MVLAALGAVIAGIAFPREARSAQVPAGNEEDVALETGLTPAVILGPGADPAITILPLEPSAE